MSLSKVVLSALGGIGASFASMLCCTGPLVLASMGVSSAGLSNTFRPAYRPFFLVVAGVLLYLAYRVLDRTMERECESERPCTDPRVVRRVRYLLWGLTVVSLVFATSPRWAPWFLG